ncbi:CsgG/HfaB family protein [Rosettibacter firmus]|uniref:CsgG/HfaB family protein n=1 Tax=Rosettibacter firmus TaxID=3111522 RepID=UPI00336BCD9B
MKYTLRTFLLVIFCTSILSAQTFKVIVNRFEDRTGRISKTEGEVKASSQVGAIAGRTGESSIGGVAAASGQASGSRLESEKGDLGYQASDVFTTELVKTGKFKVLDFSLFERKLSEIQSGDIVEAAKLIGAHFLLSGNISEAGIAEKGGSILGFGGKAVEGKVRINITLTNTTTGEIVLSETAQGTETQGGVTLFGSDVGAKKDLGLLLSAALKSAADSCVKKIEKVVGDLSNYPIECDVALSEGIVYLGKGKDDGISVGDEFEIIGVGKTIKIGSKVIEEKIKKGIIRVNEVSQDYATALPNGIDIVEGDKAVKIVKK